MSHRCYATIPMGISSMTTHNPGPSRTLVEATDNRLVCITEREGVWAELVAAIRQLPAHYAEHCQRSPRH